MNQIQQILDQALAGDDISPESALTLLQQTTPENLIAIQQTANFLRQKQAGDTVTYVINRNINFTNICEQHCSFCAFRRDAENEEAFWLDNSKILEKTAEAVTFGATEICMQGGLNPKATINSSSLQYYQKLISTIKHNFPQLHLHAFSPQEIQFISREDNLTFTEVIKALKNSGLNSMPGTAAEILNNQIRRIICPEKIDSQTWLEIVETAHQIGLPTTSTMLCGHIEKPAHQIEHLNLLRELQKTAIKKQYPAHITEFILLPFVGAMAPAPLRHRVGKNQPILADTLLLTAVSRIFLGNWIPNHQPSWVKLGLAGAIQALEWGCNDIGGTLMEEHITTMAGAQGGTCKTPQELRAAITSINRNYQQRDTLYQQSTVIL